MLKVSVIVPVYNGDEYIESCIKNILNQIYRISFLLLCRNVFTIFLLLMVKNSPLLVRVSGVFSQIKVKIF